MRSIKRFIVVLIAVAVASSPALAQTATFDDLPSGVAVPPGYTLSGSIWDNIFTINEANVTPAGKEVCAVSDPNCVYNGSGVMSSISRAATFDFTSAYFMAWADNNCSPDVFDCAIRMIVTGYNAGAEVASRTISLAPDETQFFQFDFSAVDRVTFNTQFFNQGARAWYLGDNFVFNQNEVVIPEPASMVLLGTGLVGLYGVARRRRGHKQI